MTSTDAPLIGILGKKRAGKDTFASRLVDAHGYRRAAFADALKASALDLDPIVSIEADEVGPLREAGFAVPWATPLARLSQIVDAVGWEAAKEVREVRRILQAYGLSLRERTRDDLWIRAAIDPALATGEPVVVTDVRFPNEADEIQRLGGFLVRVVRPDRPDDGDTHVSEIALDGRTVHFVATNIGTVEDLHRFADVIARRVDYVHSIRA